MSTNLQDYISTAKAVQEEIQQRLAIEQSDEYKFYSQKIDDMVAEREKLMSKIPDSTEDLEICKKALIDELNEKGELDCPGIQVKTRKSNHVDVYRVLQAFDGDLDNLMIVADIKQTALKKFCKENKQYKNVPKECIVCDGEKVVDISIE